MNSLYTFESHLHNFAIWTAARAVNRNFTTTSNIKTAIEASDLFSFAFKTECNSIEEFEAFHRKCSIQLINKFKEIGIETTYGRAAKIISVYLKTTVIIPGRGNCNKSKLIHPPIDRILLKNIAQNTSFKNLKNKNWTTLNEEEYWVLAFQLKQYFKTLNWELEKYWTPEVI